MKRILITGMESYIGVSVEIWLKQPQFNGRYQVDTIDMHGEGWKKYSFSRYDTVFHVAGLAHADVKKISEKQKIMYYKINCDLAEETAKKAKKEGVKQFIYMSSIIVYGENVSLKKRIITKNTKPAPSNFYGDSKWKAEQKLEALRDTQFAVAILRPPMIYGKGGKGNYQLLKKIALVTPIFPDFPNQRSMLHIDTLSEFIRQIIEKNETGLFFPQEQQFVKTADLVKKIREAHGKKIYLLHGFNWLIFLLSYIPGRTGRMVKKAFGSLIYENGKG